MTTIKNTTLNQLNTVTPGALCPTCNINKKFYILFEHFDGGVIIEDLSRKINFVNKKFVEMFSLALPIEDIIGKNSKEILLRNSHLFQNSQEYQETISEIHRKEEPFYGQHIRMSDNRMLHLDYVPVKRDGFTIAHMWFYKDVSRFIVISDSLKYRLDLESIITELSGMLISARMEDLNDIIDYGLERIATFLGTDRSYIMLFDKDYKFFSNTNEWCAEGIMPRKNLFQNISTDSLPWVFEKLLKKEVILHSFEELPDEAKTEKELINEWGIKSSIAVPLNCSNTLLGCIGFEDVRKTRYWDKDTQNMLSLFASLISGALQRNEFEKSILANQQHVLAALEKEKELNEMKSRFVSLVSHEFRTPLSAILSSSEILEYYSENLSLEKKELQYNRIKSSINNLLDILNDVSDLNRIDSHRTLVKSQEIDYSNFLNNILAELEIVYTEKPEIVNTTSVDGNKIMSDEKLLRQIIMNLVSNAIKFTPHHKKVYITSEITESRLSFTVADEGIGIPVEEHGKIFQPFTRSKNARNIKGSGLGLSIVKKAVELMNGEINLKSIENTGTTINVTIPI